MVCRLGPVVSAKAGHWPATFCDSGDRVAPLFETSSKLSDWNSNLQATAEQAGEVAGQLTDQEAKQAVLNLAERFELLARAAANPTVLRRRGWRGSAGKGTRNFSALSDVSVAAEPTVRRGRRLEPAQHGGRRTPGEGARITERKTC